MSTTTRNILIAACILTAGFLIWYFSNIVLYILAALVMSLIGRPIYEKLGKVHFRRLFLSPALRSLITLFLLILIVVSFLGLFIPLLVLKVQELSQIDPKNLINIFKVPIVKINQFINHFILRPGNTLSIDQMIQGVVADINISKVAGIFGSIAGWLGNLSVAFFAIAFITFFFLKDQTMFSNAVLRITPEKYKEAVSNAMQATRLLMTRYFVGILIELSAVILLSTIGFLILGFMFKDALLVGFLAGIFNIIPYLGPVIGTVFSLFVGTISYMGHPGDRNTIVMAILIVAVCSIVQFIDNMLVQPYVYSNSVHAHPLEIFLIFLIAGSLGGFAGMILAVPAYIVVREFAKEFINNFKLAHSITRQT